MYSDLISLLFITLECSLCLPFQCLGVSIINSSISKIVHFGYQLKTIIYSLGPQCRDMGCVHGGGLLSSEEDENVVTKQFQ